MWRIVIQCKCGWNKEVNGYFSGSNKAFRISHPPISRMTSLVTACLTIKMESYQSDICCFRAMTLSPLHLVVNWPVFPLIMIMDLHSLFQCFYSPASFHIVCYCYWWSCFEIISLLLHLLGIWVNSVKLSIVLLSTQLYSCSSRCGLCVSVWTITFEQNDPWCRHLCLAVHLNHSQDKFACQGHRSKLKAKSESERRISYRALRPGMTDRGWKAELNWKL